MDKYIFILHVDDAVVWRRMAARQEILPGRQVACLGNVIAVT